jgi:hypothetical protein
MLYSRVVCRSSTLLVLVTDVLRSIYLQYFYLRVRPTNTRNSKPPRSS